MRGAMFLVTWSHSTSLPFLMEVRHWLPSVADL